VLLCVGCCYCLAVRTGPLRILPCLLQLLPESSKLPLKQLLCGMTNMQLLLKLGLPASIQQSHTIVGFWAFKPQADSTHHNVLILSWQVVAANA